ncbi:hypothetical protein [Methylobacterium brachythecii]|uniref:Uncharacterized protein n=1 Tax=Methylobacterium brachythecii TaxID=1176177 RepID=A0A7W6AKH2_9HYPH|nr:hypothetical protein [Methylobacterium brachythecii]MBB3905080.1 hypothetical protein [Methylobacterium brachythecii]GLS44412.1 hypothetical protein GCM10007884_24000 [Methylobacterium brachythecii]
MSPLAHMLCLLVIVIGLTIAAATFAKVNAWSQDEHDGGVRRD